MFEVEREDIAGQCDTPTLCHFNFLINSTGYGMIQSPVTVVAEGESTVDTGTLLSLLARQPDFRTAPTIYQPGSKRGRMAVDLQHPTTVSLLQF